MADENWKPLGWQQVPKEPTHAMLDAAYRKMRMDPSCAPFSKRILLKAWDAMLETAPQSPDAVVTNGWKNEHCNGNPEVGHEAE